MIFSIICEELGLVGAGIIILLFFLLIWRFFVIATKAPDLLGCVDRVRSNGPYDDPGDPEHRSCHKFDP